MFRLTHCLFTLTETITSFIGVGMRRRMCGVWCMARAISDGNCWIRWKYSTFLIKCRFSRAFNWNEDIKNVYFWHWAGKQRWLCWRKPPYSSKRESNIDRRQLRRIDCLSFSSSRQAPVKIQFLYIRDIHTKSSQVELSFMFYDENGAIFTPYPGKNPNVKVHSSDAKESHESQPHNRISSMPTPT